MLGGEEGCMEELQLLDTKEMELLSVDFNYPWRVEYWPYYTGIPYFISKRY